MRPFQLAALLIAIGPGALPASAQRLTSSDTSAVAPPPAQPLFTQSGAWPMGGLHFGAPSGMSTTLGIAYGMGRKVPGSLFVDGELGLTSYRYGVGYLVYDERALGIGAAVRVARLKAWSSGLGATRGLTYSGVQGTALGFGAMSLRLGYYIADDAGTPRNLTTVDVGIGF